MARPNPFLILALLGLPGTLPVGGVEFRSDVLPLLSENCFSCHGPDAGTRKAGLRLDLRDAAMAPAESGKAAIVPGNPDASELIARIDCRDPEQVMPPPDSKKILPPQALATFRQWIKEGAVYQEHWAFDPIKRPSPPTPRDSAWPRNEIDRFILDRLEHEELHPSPEAPKHTLIRRLSLDLTGLPPTPEEIAAFQGDDAPGAYERVVDRLLASPRYGERMALPWLDVARYADSNGFQQDGDNHQYVWRDWVVRALNANMPFDRFAIEQLAGDLLPSPTNEQLVATAFNRNHQLNGEGGAIAEEQRAVILFDRVDVTATTFLGLTMACAQCHDHKYDPLPQRDYYSLMAFFNQVPETGVPPGGGQYRIADPWIHAGSPDQMAELARLDAAVKSVAEIRPEVLAAQSAWEESLAKSPAPAWKVIRPVSASADHGVALDISDDHSIFAAGSRPDKSTYVINLPPSSETITGLHIETLPDDRLPSKGAGLSDSGNAVLTRVRLSAGGREIHLTAAAADYSQGGFSPGGVLNDDPSSGWAFYPEVTRPHFLLVQSAEPIASGQTLTLTLEFQSAHKQHLLGRFKLSATSAPDPAPLLQAPQPVLSAISKPIASRNPAERKVVLDHFIKSSTAPDVVAFRNAKAAAESAAATFRNSLPMVMVMSDAKPRKTHIFDRGNYVAPLAEVQPDTPECLPPLPSGAPRNRLTLARWLVGPENPLTARVQVNRYWQLFFGNGLVKSTENLGVQADPPTHPQLLDWLAAEFRESGWNVKHIHRLIVTSATYRQSAKIAPAMLEIDPENKLLARSPRFRLPSPLLRDLALASGGLLVPSEGGKPVYPYQPKNIWDGLSVTKERDFTYPQSTGADLYRRSLYTFWRRTVAPGNMFDASSRSICSVKPSRTNTPIHALTTLNDVTWIEAARALAATSIRESSPDNASSQISRAFLRVCSRMPSPQESEVLLRSFEKARETFEADPTAAAAYLKHGEAFRESPVASARFAALAAVCHSILNLDEALTRG